MARELTKQNFPKIAGPAWPLKASGEVWHQGWDIPSHWAVDAENVPWADYSCHGSHLTKTDFDTLIKHLDAEDGKYEQTSNQIREYAGRKKVLPEWAKTALHFKWTPPEGFKREDYE